MAKRPFNIWGTHAVTALLKHNPHHALEVWLSSERNSEELIQITNHCKASGITLSSVSNKALDKLCNQANHQGAVAKRRSPITSDLGAMVSAVLQGKTAPMFMALDQVKDPQNLGACLRLADVAGVDGMIIPEASQAPLSGVVAKIASGAMDTVPIVQINNFGNGLRDRAKQGGGVVGTDDGAAQAYTEIDLTVPLCWVFGSEQDGLRQRTRDICDYLVSIPMVGAVGSLNVSNAAAVCLFEARRQRQQITSE